MTLFSIVLSSGSVAALIHLCQSGFVFNKGFVSAQRAITGIVDMKFFLVQVHPAGQFKNRNHF